MISTLDDLVAPLTGAELRGLLAARELRVVRRGDAAPYRALLDWDRLTDLALTGAYPAQRLRITRGAEDMASIFFRDGDMPRPDAIRTMMAAGASMVMYGLENHMPEVGRLAESIAAELGEKIAVGTVQSVGPGGAVKLHYDRSDVLAIQIEGRKRWLIGRDAIIDPVPGMTENAQFDADDVLDITLDPGDMLVLPAGYPHHCDNVAERSLHMAVFIYPMTAPRMLDLMFRAMIQEPEARRPFRFAHHDPAAQAELRELIIRRVRETSFDELLAQHSAANHNPKMESD